MTEGVPIDGKSDERKPIGEVLAGMAIHPMGEGEVPDFAFVLVRHVAEGDRGWSYRTTAVPNREELLGALEVQCQLLRKELVSEWE